MEVPHSRRNRSPLLASTNLCPLRRCSDGRGSGGRTLGTACKSGKRVGAPTCAGRRGHGHRVQGYRSEKKVAPGSGCTQRVCSSRHSQSVARVLHKPLHQEGVGNKWQAGAKKHNEIQKRAKRLETETLEGLTSRDWTILSHTFSRRRIKLGMPSTTLSTTPA